MGFDPIIFAVEKKVKVSLRRTSFVGFAVKTFSALRSTCHVLRRCYRVVRRKFVIAQLAKKKVNLRLRAILDMSSKASGFSFF